ncbi:DUF11 domain-containing protein [Sulfurovum sp. TSL1]|uniref:DUF11 domain-containing protein n=1 Tax=Sulfurovum sp. TSL1 TaxID=2826994 RepID=UPI001CC68B88|nr:DUF11 domain-containing protein [Sulfurovum sp. TSL1]GIT98414.1 hypothetical protein TSL1_12350 [Sulfurovum sp. TSL1]
MKKNLLNASVQNVVRLKYILIFILSFFFSIQALGAPSCSSYHSTSECNAVSTCTWDDASSVCVASDADIDLLIAKTPSSRVVDLNDTITYVLTVANEAKDDAEVDNHVTVIDTLPPVTGLTDFQMIDDAGFNCTIDGSAITPGMPLTDSSVLTCIDGEIDGRTGNSGVPGLIEIWYSFRAPDYNTELNNTVEVSALNDTTNNTKSSYATVYVYDGNLILNPPPPEHADVIDTFTTQAAYNDGTSKVIKTKIAAKTFTPITGVHLNGDNVAVPYQHTDPDMSFIVIPYLSDNSCITQKTIIDSDTGLPMVFNITDGMTAVEANMTVDSSASRASRILVSYIDLGAILDNTGVKCVYTSSTQGNLAGLGQCVNSANNYYDAFGLSAYERCNVLNGQPCTPSNGGYSCGPNDTSCTGYNPLYDNEVGCLMCTLNAFPECSTDNFAIRPERFDINATHQNFPHLLRAGEDYPIALTARDAVGSATDQYTISDYPFNDDINASAIKYFNDNYTTLATDDLMFGNLTMNDSYLFYSINGLSSSSASIEPATAEESIHIAYDDVGDITLHVQDQNWSAVDNDDTPMNCDENGTYICGDRNITFIPHHFKFAELNITNHAGPDSNFTYIADNRGMPSTNPPTRSPMAARIKTRIEALNKDGNITRNFRTGALYYENNITVTPTVIVPTYGNPNGYLFPDANESNISNQLVGFGRPGTEDENGTRYIDWNESTYPLDFNFRREINQPANPFDVNGSYLSISMLSQYVDPEDGDTADINGSRIGDQNTSTTCAADPGCVEENAENNATFYYGRARPSLYIYDDIITSSVNTPIAIDVYCDLLFTECSDKGIDTDNAQINEADWWLSLNHTEDSTRHDGNVTLQTGIITPSGTASISSTISTDPAAVRITSGGIDPDVTVTATSSDRPMTVPIELVHNILPLTLPYYTATPPYTNSWLIYNEDSLNLPSPFYKVRFIGSSDWAGHGDTGHVVDSNVSTKKNRRLEW